MKVINVAIDGPAGAGKSSISKAVAKKLGYIYVDTGAMYRAIALKMINENILPGSNEIENVLNSTSVDIKYINSEQHIFLDGEDVSEKIRTPEVSVKASDFSSLALVRAKLLSLQRNLAEKNSCIMDGRDIGTFVLPNADVKIFLTASAFVRAQRRCKELLEKGESVNFDDVLKDIIYRDKNDSEREIAPLRKADDAILVDTSDLSFEDSIQKIYDVINEHLNR